MGTFFRAAILNGDQLGRWLVLPENIFGISELGKGFLVASCRILLNIL